MVVSVERATEGLKGYIGTRSCCGTERLPEFYKLASCCTTAPNFAVFLEVAVDVLVLRLEESSLREISSIRS